MEKVAVIGAGVIGRSAAMELAARGLEVTLFDPAADIDPGPVRAFRQSHTKPELVELSWKARSGWQKWQERAGSEMLLSGGFMLEGDPARPVKEMLGEAEVPHRWLRAGMLAGSGKVYREGLWEPAGGTIWARRVMSFLKEENGSILRPEIIYAVAEKDSVVEVWSDSGRHIFDGLLATTGASQLLPGFSSEIAARTSSQLCLHYAVTGAEASPSACFIDHRSGFYGMPLPGLESYCVGSLRDFETLEEAEEAIRVFVCSDMPGLDGEPVAAHVYPKAEIRSGGSDWAARSEGPITAFTGSDTFMWAPVHGEQLALLLTGEETDRLWLERASLGYG